MNTGKARDKIKSAAEIRSLTQNRGLKTVFTNGCFDLLHLGHARYLEEAKELGDVLIVGVNSDESVRKIKGANRPINPQNDRAELVASLEPVDFVTFFDEETPIELIKKIGPDIHVKGGDYRIDDLPEAEVVKSYGGEVVILNEVKGKSTSALIETICEKEQDVKD